MEESWICLSRKHFISLFLGRNLLCMTSNHLTLSLVGHFWSSRLLLVEKKHWESTCGETSANRPDSRFWNIGVEDLYLDFMLPGYPDYVLTSGSDHKMVNMKNLEDYVALLVDATTYTGIYRQVEAFRSGFCQVFSIKHYQTTRHIFLVGPESLRQLGIKDV